MNYYNCINIIIDIITIYFYISIFIRFICIKCINYEDIFLNQHYFHLNLDDTDYINIGSNKKYPPAA